MTAAAIGNVVCDVDADATRRVYERISCGGTTSCGCAYCRNFAAQVPAVFPAEVLAFFDAAGIDPTKDAEVYELGESSPGSRMYGGEFYFICTSRPPAESGVLSCGFQFAFTEPSPLVPEAFHGMAGAICFYFTCEAPWVIAGGT